MDTQKTMVVMAGEKSTPPASDAGDGKEKKMRGLQPLTLEEQEIAEKNIGMVDSFLRRNHLDPAEYYDVVIFGYLEAVQRECRNPAPPEVSNFNGLVQTCMKRKVMMDYRYKKCRWRVLNDLSLDSKPDGAKEDDDTYLGILPDIRQNTEQAVLNRDLITRIMAEGTPRQLEAISLVCQGYEPHEGAGVMGITRLTMGRTLANFRMRAKAVRDDRDVIKCPYKKESDKEKCRLYQRARREQHRAYQAAYKKENPEKRKEWDKTYYYAHREEILRKQREKRAAANAEKAAQDAGTSQTANVNRVPA